MGMRRMMSFGLVLSLLFATELSRGWGDDMQGKLDEMKGQFDQFSQEHKLDDKAEAFKQDASEAYGQVKDKAETWSDWAYDKMKGMGKEEGGVKETAHFLVDEAGQAATETTQKLTGVLDGSNHASAEAEEPVMRMKSKSEDVAEAAAEKTKAEEAEMGLKSKSENVVGAAAEKADDLKIKAREMAETGKEKVPNHTKLNLKDLTQLDEQRIMSMSVAAQALNGIGPKITTDNRVEL